MNPWPAMAAALGAFLLLFLILQIYARFGAAPETTRKLLHTGSGLLTLSFPFLFKDVWPVLLLTGATALLIGAVKFVPALRRLLGKAVSGVDRTTLGEIYFPVSVAALFWLTHGADPLLFVVPVLVLTLADATCAIIGLRYGLTRYSGASKSFEGSAAFTVVAFMCVHVPLLLWSDVGREESLLIAATLALLVMMLEGSAWRGLDNLFIPIGGYFLLRAYLPMGTADLAARLAVTVALVLLIVFSRTRTTLEDDSLVAGAFLCYIAWALMGWPWLLAPLVVFVGYAWLSPGTSDNSRRMHDVAVVLAVWGPALAWLTLARTTRTPSMLLPYTTVFATHLAMFGVSRLAHQFQDRRLASLFWRAVVMSWMIVMIPYVAATGAHWATIAGAVAAGPAIALGAWLFVHLTDIRNAPQTRHRWLVQAGAAAVASITVWAMALLLHG